MKDQHTLIKGYRDLPQETINQINAVKELEAQIANLWLQLKEDPNVDQRALSLARTNFEQGCMWATKAIGRSASPFDPAE